MWYKTSTAPDGEIVFDARVVQATLRSAVATSYEAEILLNPIATGKPTIDPVFTPEEEAIAGGSLPTGHRSIARRPARRLATSPYR